ncbi:hypothetical protein ACFL2O_10770 [Thermodesulfobacteriota bacterium]
MPDLSGFDNSFLPMIPEWVVATFFFVGLAALIWAVVHLVILIFRPIVAEMDEGLED